MRLHPLFLWRQMKRYTGICDKMIFLVLVLLRMIIYKKNILHFIC